MQIAGVDEAGRGPLAGPVTAAAVILDPNDPIAGLNDSKKLSENKRNYLEQEIKQKALSWCVATASVEEIDQVNILQASLLAMKRAVEGLSMTPQLALIDGNHVPNLQCRSRAVIRGDSIHPEISAASILAKQSRDRLMCRIGLSLPLYGFDRHKGYPTTLHLEALNKYGVTEHHRKSFAPVQKILVR